MPRFRQQPPALGELAGRIERGDEHDLGSSLNALHAADLAELLGLLKREHWETVLERLEIAAISGLLEELPEHLQDDLAGHLERDRLERVIGGMPSDSAADVLADLPRGLARELLRSLPDQHRRDVAALLEYPEDSAGGLMQVELISLPEDATVAWAVEAIRAGASEADPLHVVYAVHEDQRLAGVLRLPDLILTAPQTRIREIMKRDFHAVTPGVDQEQVARMFQLYDLVALPVVDEDGRLLGHILHDDAVDVLEHEADEDMLHIAGARPDGPDLVYTDQLLKIASIRLPWLLTTMVGLTLSAVLYGLFQSTFPHTLMLIPFIPVISAMGGNVGSQSSIIVVRGLATGRLSRHNLGRYWAQEMLISLVLGSACGLLCGAAAAWFGDLRLAVTVSVSMTCAIVAAASMGVLVPCLFRRAGIDPAIAAGPFITTLEDILATLIYFLFAVLLMAA